jgi:hypothetical protein
VPGFAGRQTRPMRNDDLMLLVLVARGGMMLVTSAGSRSVQSADADGSQLAEGIHRGLLGLIDTGHLDTGPGGHLRLTVAGGDILRGTGAHR